MVTSWDTKYMALCETSLSPLLMLWRYCSLPFRHLNKVIIYKYNVLAYLIHVITLHTHFRAMNSIFQSPEKQMHISIQQKIKTHNTSTTVAEIFLKTRKAWMIMTKTFHDTKNRTLKWKWYASIQKGSCWLVHHKSLHCRLSLWQPSMHWVRRLTHVLSIPVQWELWIPAIFSNGSIESCHAR